MTIFYRILIKTFLLITCISILTSCKNIEEVKISSVEKFYLNKISLENIDGELQLKINNPNNYGFSIYPSEFEIIFSGIRLGKAKLSKAVKLHKKTEKVYIFKLNTKISELNPLDALQLINLKNIGKIEINGDLKVGKLFLRKKIPINYSEKINLLK
jgi:LEA14-like dessication related protein